MENLEHTVGDGRGFRVDTVKQRSTYTKGAINSARIRRDEFRGNVRAWDKEKLSVITRG